MSTTDDIAAHDASQLVFKQAVPFEVLANIFGMLTQADCLRCMSVSRTWYNAVPLYTRHCFRTVILKGNRGQVNNIRFQKCLGPHVKSVVLNLCDTQQQLEALISMLQRHNCDSVVQLCKCPFRWVRMSFLIMKMLSGIRKCRVFDGSTLIHHLQHFEQLKRISFHNTALHIPIMPFLSSLISVCQSLTHLTCNTTSLVEADSLQQSTLEHNSEINHNMRFLRLGLPDSSLKQAMEVLVRCPDLRYFSSSSVNNTDARMVLSTCPKLAYFECQIYAKRYLQWLHHDINDIQSSSLEQQSHQTSTSLIELALEPISFEQQLHDMHHPHLQRLELNVTQEGEEIIRTLLQNTPLVEELQLNYYEMVDYIPTMIQSLSNLRTLQLTFNRTRTIYEEFASMFQGFHQLPPHLSVGIVCKLYTPLSSPDIDDILTSIAGIRQLKDIYLHISLSTDSDNNLISFFERVSHQIEAITLCVTPVSSSLLSLIAHRFRHLVHLRLLFCTRVNLDGLRTLVNTKTRTSAGTLSLEIEDCAFEDGAKTDNISVCIGQDPFPSLLQ